MRGATRAGDERDCRLVISIHAPRAGCDSAARWCLLCTSHFNPRTPCGVRLRRHADYGNCNHISIHAPRAGVRPVCAALCLCRACHFNPRTPCGVRPKATLCLQCSRLFQSTHPVRGATASSVTAVLVTGNFNPRTPCGVRRPRRSRLAADAAFQSTHPVRGATCVTCVSRGGRQNFNPRTPCGVRLGSGGGGVRSTPFQSTHPVRGATRVVRDRIKIGIVFQSTHPVRGATRSQFQQATKQRHISIHAPRAGCDTKGSVLSDQATDFNPRTPCGVRPRSAKRSPETRWYFNPRTPCGVRLVMHGYKPIGFQFQSTHPVRGATPARTATITAI